jgi:hypothetical protein
MCSQYEYTYHNELVAGGKVLPHFIIQGPQYKIIVKELRDYCWAYFWYIQELFNCSNEALNYQKYSCIYVDKLLNMQIFIKYANIVIVSEYPSVPSSSFLFACIECYVMYYYCSCSSMT